MAGRIYFAYGSNLSVEQMETRCPNAAPLERATLRGWRWLIMSRGWATVTPDPASSVEGLLWVITDTDERSLDRYEGVSEGLYTKEVVEVEQASGGRVQAMIYVSPDTTPGPANPGYLERIIASATERKFPAEWIEMLRSWLSRG